MTGFELNEKLKEWCIQTGATKAITEYFKKGVPILAEPFYETLIEFPKDTPVDAIARVYQVLVEYKFLFDRFYYCTEPLIEKDSDQEKYRIVYAIFMDNIPFDAEISISDTYIT